LEAQVRSIPDLDERFVAFLRNQVECENWRNARHSERAPRLLREGYAEAERLKSEGVPREELFRRFFAVLDKIRRKPEVCDSSSSDTNIVLAAHRIRGSTSPNQEILARWKGGEFSLL
jgi:hypothetical protein